MLPLLALDLATTTGWAYTNGNQQYTGSVCFKKNKTDIHAQIFKNCYMWLKSLHTTHPVKTIVTEQAHLRGRAPTEIALGFYTMIKIFSFENSITLLKPVHSLSIKKYATGSGKASKKEMIQCYIDKWQTNPTDDNEADARWLLDLVLSR